jgi:tripartite ATP-independent transporter DctM subunit
MEWYYSLILMLGLITLLMILGVPIAFAFFLTNIVGATIFLGGIPGIEVTIPESMSAIANFGLAPIVLFLVIGEILLRSGLAFRSIDAIDKAIRSVPGRLSVVSVVGGTLFSALSGSTIAVTAMLGESLAPNMLRRGYHPTMTTGPIMAIGGVDMLIPPSNLAVIFATIASSVSLVKVSVAALLMAGILPGLMMSGGFIAYIVVRCWMNPKLAPPAMETDVSSRDRWLPLLTDVAPLLVIFGAMMGSMYAGWATPTDSAALGTIATLVVAAAFRALSFKMIVEALKATAMVTTMLFFIIAASTTFAHILAISGATDGALGALSKLNLAPIGAVLCMIGVLLVLGCFMEQIAMMLLTLPFFIPLANSLHIDMLWLSIVLLISLQVGLLTPPFGVLIFVMRGVVPREITTQQIWASVVPFVAIILSVLGLILIFPWIATGLWGNI